MKKNIHQIKIDENTRYDKNDIHVSDRRAHLAK